MACASQCAQGELERKADLVVHVVGAAQHETPGCPAWEELLHLMPALRTLHVAFVGPAVEVVVQDPQDARVRGSVCREGGLETPRATRGGREGREQQRGGGRHLLRCGQQQGRTAGCCQSGRQQLALVSVQSALRATPAGQGQEALPAARTEPSSLLLCGQPGCCGVCACFPAGINPCR